jgi:predicted enzyme related to lactoylglutathione lyase
VITGVRKIIVPVYDQDRAIAFWTRQLGFALVGDQPYGGDRWIEVSPPDRSVVLVLSRRPADQPRPEVPEELPHSPVFFNCDDIERTHRELAARGVRFPAPPKRMPFGWWAMFEDVDGTRYALGQW